MPLAPRSAAIAVAAACAAIAPTAALGTINLAPGATNLVPAGTGSGQALGSMAVGADGNVWYGYSAFAGPQGALQAMAPGTMTVVGSNPVPSALFPSGTVGQYSLTNGPDGNLWFVEGSVAGSQKYMGDMTTAGAFASFPLAGDATPGALTSAGGYLWGVGPNAVMQITTAGVITSFPLPAGVTGTSAIAQGNDGAIWFGAQQAGAAALGRLTPTAGGVPEIQMVSAPVDSRGGSGSNSSIAAIAPGPSGSVWAVVQTFSQDYLADTNGPIYGLVASATTAGATTVAPLPSYSCLAFCAIVQAQDGNGWLNATSAGAIDRVTPSGRVTQYPIVTTGTNSMPAALILGPDRNLWFQNSTNGNIGMMAIWGGTPFPAPTATVISGSARSRTAQAGKPLSITFQAGSSAAGNSTITLVRGGTSVRLWKGTVQGGTTRTVKMTVPRSFPVGKATLRFTPPKSAGRASASVVVKRA